MFGLFKPRDMTDDNSGGYYMTRTEAFTNKNGQRGGAVNMTPIMLPRLTSSWYMAKRHGVIEDEDDDETEPMVGGVRLSQHLSNRAAVGGIVEYWKLRRH